MAHFVITIDFFDLICLIFFGLWLIVVMVLCINNDRKNKK